MSTATETRRRSGYASVNGLRMYYEIRGTGTPLVLLHGGVGAHEMFGPNLEAFARGRQVIAAYLQGHYKEVSDLVAPFLDATLPDGK